MDFPLRRVARWFALVVLCVVAMSVSLVRAAGAGDAAPLVRASTLAVAYVDLSRVDPQAAADWLVAVFEANQTVAAADRDAIVKQIRDGAPELSRRLQAGREAGLREAFLVFDMPNPTSGRPNDPVVALRVADGASPEQALAAMFGEAPRGDEIKLIAGLHVMGRPEQVERLASSVPAKRAEFDKAAGAAGDAPLAVVIAPPAGSLNVFPMLLPQLPAEFGGTDTKDLCDGVEAFAVYGTTPANPKFDVQILCSNPKVLADAIARTRAGIAATLQSGKLPGGVMDSARATLAANLLETLPAFVAADGAVTLSLDEPALRKLADASLTPLVEARRSALGMQGTNHARSLLMGVLMYANENKGVLPESLADLDQYLNNGVATLKIIPGTDGEEFTYLAPAGMKLGEIQRAANTVVIIQPIGEKPATERIIVGFLDGHVEMLTVEELRNRVKDGTIVTADGRAL